MNRIRALRKEKNWSQSELADFLHVHQTAISQWEKSKTEPDKSNLLALSELFGVSTDYLLGRTESPIPAQEPSEDDALRAEVLDLMADPASETVHVIGNTKASAGLIVCGDSMIPDFFDGDIVLIRLQDDVDDGQIAAVAIDDTVALKRVYHVSGGVQLISSNPQYPPMFFGANNCDSVRIIGLAVGFQRAL